LKDALLDRFPDVDLLKEDRAPSPGSFVVDVEKWIAV
jgi:hypothetical protein